MLGTYECEQEKSSPGLICHVMRQGAVGHLHRHGAMAGRKLLIVISSPWQKKCLWLLVPWGVWINGTLRFLGWWFNSTRYMCTNMCMCICVVTWSQPWPHAEAETKQHSTGRVALLLNYFHPCCVSFMLMLTRYFAVSFFKNPRGYSVVRLSAWYGVSSVSS